MLSKLSETAEQRLHLAVITIAGLLRFVNLGFTDLQAWDEALYAVRAEGVLVFGSWVDQAEFAIDGLYSALHPPLYVWLTAISFSIFDVTEFSVRFFSAVSGILTLSVVYFLGRELSNRSVGFLAALLFGLNPFVLFFSRQGQFDSTLTLFLSLAVLCLLISNRRKSRTLAIVAGMITGAALMTKLFVGWGIPLAYLLWIVTHRKARRERGMQLGLLLLGTILVAAPWHVFMTVTHGDGDIFFFLNASSLVERSVSGIEGNVKPLEVFYYFNQLLVLFPAGVFFFGFGLLKTIRSREAEWWFMGLWFLVFFIVFSTIRTKLAVYLLPMLVPVSLIAAHQIHECVRGTSSRRTFSLLLAGTALSLAWAASQVWRNGIKSVAGSIARFTFPSAADLYLVTPLVGILALILLVTALDLRRPFLDPVRRFLLPLILVPSLLLCCYDVFILDTVRFKDGATELAELVDETDLSGIVVAGYERNPQLTYYLEGLDIDWRDDITFRRVIPPKDRAEFRSWLTSEVVGETEDVLLIVEKDKFIRYEWVTADEVRPPDWSPVFDSRRYAAFMKKPVIQHASLLNGPAGPVVVYPEL